MLKADVLKKDYIEWFSKKIEFKNLEENLVRIDVPFQDNMNDDIVFYAELDSNTDTIILTDDGYTLFNLESSGLNIKGSKRRKKIFFDNLSSYGVNFNQKTEEIYTTCKIKEFSEVKHRFLQCLIFVNDMYLLSEGNVKHIFAEDVERVLDNNEIIYTKDLSIIGRSGMTHKFDFLISSTKNKPEKFIKTISSPNNSMVIKALVTDVNQAKLVKREKPNKIIAILNDKEKEISSSSENLLEDSGVSFIKFKDLNKNIDLLRNNA
ncbi:hypothetical protein CW670_04150 [Macrococcoides caseolyticum]|uniref:DUF1829 domain-containing protein n=1 Tax=Macrococcus psychrotolerans TaxID=3039389 RepID=A0AAT9P4I0_9STAP|nr:MULTISPECIES: DUF1829 domain-containing protein [Macrococcus]PKE36354.1 hypothetical protein CW695_03130 [Macrococcus caseolyticus]PKE61527.1 hypothetical protein CW669_03575 [Macrococcus caseolyticus]PKE74911.1 hypothetical protein CW670_04150 [Macrococcus caseolyticus]QYA32263.1 DUF1829 domain-containing protein [Macrococcus sp. 19Msa1099]QYA37069.1 DUF1829 domain-containing protein [Macrococcus caseolyticus]